MSAGAGAQTLSYPSTQYPGTQRVMQTVRVTR